MVYFWIHSTFLRPFFLFPSSPFVHVFLLPIFSLFFTFIVDLVFVFCFLDFSLFYYFLHFSPFFSIVFSFFVFPVTSLFPFSIPSIQRHNFSFLHFYHSCNKIFLVRNVIMDFLSVTQWVEP